MNKAGIAIVSTVVITVLLAGVFSAIHHNAGESKTTISTASSSCANSVLFASGNIKFQPQNSTNDLVPNLPIMGYNSSVPGYSNGITYAWVPFSLLNGGIINGELTTNKNVDFFLYNNGASGTYESPGQIVLNQNFATVMKLDLSVNESNYAFVFILQHDYSLDSPQPLVVDITQAIALCASG